MNPPRSDTPAPQTSSEVVVPLRPKPPAYPAVSSVSRPVIIEQDVIDYLVRVPLDQRWRILSRVAMATYDEPAPASTAPASTAPPPSVEHHLSSPPPSTRQPMVVVPAPAPYHVSSRPPPPAVAPPPPSSRPQLELVDQTREVLTPPPPPPSTPAMIAHAPAPAPTPRPAAVAHPHPAPAAHPQPASAGVPRPTSAAPPRPTPAAHAAPASAAPPPAASAAPPPPAPAAAPAQRLAYSAPPPPPAQAPNAEELFEAMHELTMHESANSGARFCLQVALAAVPSLAGLVHLRDPKTMELVVVHAQGPRADSLLNTRTPQADPLLSRAARASKPTVATYGAEPDAEKTKSPRHAHFDPWSVVVVPVVHGGQLLGLLEVIDPCDGNPHDENALAALEYVASRLGRFLVDHPAAF